MWGGLSKRLKTLAEEITSPQYDEESSESEEERVSQEYGTTARRVLVPTSSNSHRPPNASSSPELSIAPRFPIAQVALDPCEDPQRRLQADLDAQRSPVPAASSGSPPPISIAPTKTATPSASKSAHWSVAHATIPINKVASPAATESFSSGQHVASPISSVTSYNATAALLPTIGSSYVPDQETPQRPLEKLADQLELSLKRVRSLEKEKRALEEGVRDYQEQVKQNHADTVAYYRRQLDEATETFNQERSEALAAHGTLMARVAELEQQLLVLQQEPGNAQHVCKRLEGMEEEQRQWRLERASLREQVATLKDTIASLRTAQQKADGTSSAPEVSHTVISKELDEKTAEVERLRLEGDTFKKLAEDLRQKLLHLSESYDKLKETIHHGRGKHEELQLAQQQKLDSMAARCAAAEEKCAGAERCAKEAQQQQMEGCSHDADAAQQMESVPEASSTEALQSGKLHSEMRRLESIIQRSETEHQVVLKALSSTHEEAITLLESEWQQRLRALEAQVSTADSQISELNDEKEEAAVRVQGLTAQLTATMEELHSAKAACAALTTAQEAAERKLGAQQSEIAQTTAELEAVRSARQSDHNRLTSGDASIASLMSLKVELEEKVSHQDALLQQLQRTVIDCITRHADVIDLPGGNSRATFSDWVVLLTSEYSKAITAVKRAARVQEEWEATYEQAREVNATVSQQLADAWKLIGELRENLSVQDETTQKLREQVRLGDERLHKTEAQLTKLANQLDAVMEDGLSAAVGCAPSPVVGEDSAASGDRLEALQSEVEKLRVALQERDDELLLAHGSIKSFQTVLETFKANRQQDVEARTVNLELVIDQLRTQLEESNRVRHEHEEVVQALKDEHVGEVAARNMEITALHRKLKDLRQALEETTRQLKGESTVDKRVISHILVNFIHAFVGQKRETDEMLKVLSGLLQWDEDTQEKVGLLPGPLNPRPQQQTRRLFGWTRGSGAAAHASTHVAIPGSTGSSPGPDPPRQKSLASLWVEFLIQESSRNNVQCETQPSTLSAEPSPPA